MQASSIRRRINAAISVHSRWRVGPAPKQRKLAKGGTFEDVVKGKTFTNPETGNKVQFSSLPDKEQKKLRQDWKKQKGGDGDGDKPKGTRVDKKMIERAQDKARSNADDAFGSMFDAESLQDTLENLDDVTYQVREAFENLYHDIESIVDDEGLTQEESTALWKEAYGALNDHVSGLLDNASGELGEEDYFKLEDAAAKGIDETSGGGPHVDEDDEKDRQKALKKHLKKNKGGKQASDLRGKLIRLAHANPKMRPHLLPLLSKTAGAGSPLLEVLLPQARWYRFMGMASQKSSNPWAYDSLLSKMYSKLEVYFKASSSWAPVLIELHNYNNSLNSFDQDFLTDRIRYLSNRVGADPNSGEVPDFDGYLPKVIPPASWFRFTRKQGSDAAILLNALLAFLEKKLESFFSSMPGKDAFWSLVALVDGNDPSESRVTPVVLKAALGLGLKSLVQDETMHLASHRTAGTESALLEALLPKVRWYQLMGSLDAYMAARGSGDRALFGKVYEALQERVRFTSNEDRALGILRNLMAKRDVDSEYLVGRAQQAADFLGLSPQDTSMAQFNGPLAKLFQPMDWYDFVNGSGRAGARLLNASLAHLESRAEVIFRSSEFRNAFWKLVKFSEGSKPSGQEVLDTLTNAADAMGLSPGQRAASRQVSAAPKTEKASGYDLQVGDQVLMVPSMEDRLENPVIWEVDSITSGKITFMRVHDGKRAIWDVSSRTYNRIKRASARQVSAARDTAAFVTWALKRKDRVSSDNVFKFLDRIGVPELAPSTNRRGQPLQVGEMVEVQSSKAPGHLQDILAPYDLRKGTIREVDGADVVVAFNAGSDIIRVPGGVEAGAKSGLYRTSVAGSDAGPHVEVVYVADRSAIPTELSLRIVQQYVDKGLASGEERSPNYYTGYCRGYATGKDGTKFFGLFSQQRDGRPRTLNPSKGEVVYIGLVGRRPGNWKNEYEDLVASEAPLGE